MNALEYTDYTTKSILDEVEATLAMSANDRRKTLRRLGNQSVDNARIQCNYSEGRWTELKNTVDNWPDVPGVTQPFIRSGSPSCFIEKCSLDVLYVLIAVLTCEDTLSVR